MSSREIVLWLDERWYDALERHIKGETLQEKLESYLDELCNNLLPDYEYEQISRAIWPAAYQSPCLPAYGSQRPDCQRHRHRDRFQTARPRAGLHHQRRLLPCDQSGKGGGHRVHRGRADP